MRAQLLDLESGGVVRTCVTSRNPLPGSNVMDHLTFAIERGTDTAGSILRSAVGELLSRLKAEGICRLAVCGNPIQLSLFQGMEIRDLAYAGKNKLADEGVPEVDRSGRIISGDAVGLGPDVEVVIPPAVRHEIGADALAMMVCSGFLDDDMCMVTDYGTNAEMVKTMIPWMDGIPGGIWEGSGHKMCYWAGAAIDRSGTPAPMVFCFQWRSITKQVRAFQGLMVNDSGQRYTNEDNVISHGGLSLLHEHGHQAFAIWDDNYANEPQWQNHAFVDGDPVFASADDVRAYWEECVNGPGTIEMNGSGQIEVKMIKADTIEELVEQLGLPAEETLAQIERYNTYCDQGYDEEFDKRPELLLPIRTAPFYGIRCTPWFLTTTGGIRCNERMQASMFSGGM